VNGLAEDGAYRQALLNCLEGEPRPAELQRLEAQGRPLYAPLLHLLTHLTFSETKARRHWRLIGEHRRAMSAALDRDVGLRVALIDYFINVNQELKNPKVIEISIYERTQRSALTDSLTGLYNHAYLLQTLVRELQRARRNEFKASLLILDLDDFKRVNDSRGHLEGDRVLRQAAQIVGRSLREIDTAARYGGEEFAVLLPDTPRLGAFVVAERIRRATQRHFGRKGGVGVTISGGVATFPDDAADPEGLIRRADQGLYRSKAAGKNRITLASGERRRHARISFAQPVSLCVEDGLRATARAHDLSAGGMLLCLKRNLPSGSRVSLQIRPSTGRPVELHGEIVRVVRRGRTGLFDVGVRLALTPGAGSTVLKQLTGVTPFARARAGA